MIEHENPQISIARQCELVGLARSSLYTGPGVARERYADATMALSQI